MPNPVKSRKFSNFVEEVNSNKEKQNAHISSSTKYKISWSQLSTKENSFLWGKYYFNDDTFKKI